MAENIGANTSIEKGDDSIERVNSNIISLIVKKSKENPDAYPPSKILKIIHRSIPSSNLKLYGLDKVTALKGKRIRGVNIELLPQDACMGLSPIFTIKNDGKELVIEGMAFPGFMFGKEILQALDSAYSEILNHPDYQKNIYRIAAFFMIMSSSTHAFIDANGRISVSLAKTFIDRDSGKNLSFTSLNARNTELISSLAISTLDLLPDEENPHVQIKKTSEPKSRINILAYDDVKKAEFFTRFKDNILQTINEFNKTLKVSNGNLDQDISRLASLLQDSSQ